MQLCFRHGVPEQFAGLRRDVSGAAGCVHSRSLTLTVQMLAQMHSRAFKPSAHLEACTRLVCLRKCLYRHAWCSWSWKTQAELQVSHCQHRDLCCQPTLRCFVGCEHVNPCKGTMHLWVLSSVQPKQAVTCVVCDLNSVGPWRARLGCLRGLG